MIKLRTRFYALLALIVVFFHCAPLSSTALAQQDQTNSIVSRVEIVGLSQVAAQQARSMISTIPGRVFDPNVAKLDQKRLLESGLFDDVAILSTPDGEQVAISYVISQRQIINSIEFLGNSHLSDRVLLNLTNLEIKKPLDTVAAAGAITAIKDKYKQDGYYFVKVDLDQQRLQLDGALIYNITEGPRMRLNDVDFEFVNSDGAFSKLKLSSMVSSGDGWWIIVPGRLSDEKIRNDVDKLRQYYHDNGYMDAEVTTSINYAADKSKAQLKFIIDEGQRYTVERVIIRGNNIFTSGDLLGRLKMTRGKFFNAQTMQIDSKSIQDTYGRIGYVNAQVTSRTVYKDPTAVAPADLVKDENTAPALVSVIYDVYEGSRYKLGRIEIRGNDITKDRVVRRLITMHPGETFDTTSMELSETNLKQCGLFETATIIPYGSDAEIRDALVEIEEGRTASVNVGIAASSDSGLSGMLSYRQTNFSWTRMPDSFMDALVGSGFKGDGQTLELRIEPGVEHSRLRASWYEPYLMDRDVSLNVGAYAERLDEDDYDQDQSGLDLGMGTSLGGLWYGSVNTGIENVKIKDLEDDSPSEFKAELGSSFFASGGASLSRDGTDSRYLPSEGGKLSLSATHTVGHYRFTKAKAEYKHYFTTYQDVLDRKHIFAVRGRVDCLFGYAPSFKRYYGGGLNHVRGFGYQGISPRTADKDKDDAIGGKLSTYLGAEYSIPLVGETVRGLVFADSGTVEAERKIRAWRAAVGVGVSLKMGNIPVIVNFAWPVMKEEEDDEELVSFSMGWFF